MHLRTQLASLLLVGAAGCDIPTSLPTWTTSWELTPVDQTITTAQLLPAAVRLDPRGFAIDSFAATASIRLGEVCELCTCFDGPIPGLEIAPHDWPVRLPPGLAEAQMLSGRARLVLRNEIGFDLLDDGQGNQGWIDVVLVDTHAGTEIDRRHITGSYPQGDTLALEFDLTGLRLYSGLVARVSGHTPGSGGCSVKLTASSGFTATVGLRDVIASSVDVVVNDQTLALTPHTFDVPAEVAKRLRPGDARIALDLEVKSRVPTSAELDLSVAPAAQDLFTSAAVLRTPFIVPRPTGADTVDAHGLYLLELDGIPAAHSLTFAARSRITGSNVIRLKGDESLEYRLHVRAEVPSR
jgi:hypothetical protein